MAVKERVGVVVSDKMDKTVVVAIENRAPHPKYKKIMVRTERYKVHDEENACKTGDRVRIQETRPLSRHKRWRVIENLTHTSSSQKATASQAATPTQEATASQAATASQETEA